MYAGYNNGTNDKHSSFLNDVWSSSPTATWEEISQIGLVVSLSPMGDPDGGIKRLRNVGAYTPLHLASISRKLEFLFG